MATAQSAAIPHAVTPVVGPFRRQVLVLPGLLNRIGVGHRLDVFGKGDLFVHLNQLHGLNLFWC